MSLSFIFNLFILHNATAPLDSEAFDGCIYTDIRVFGFDILPLSLEEKTDPIPRWTV